MGWLEGKVALLVGGGSGIGRAVVEEYLEEGASVGVLEISAEKCAELQLLGPQVLAIEGDATLLADQKRAVAATVEAFGRLDTLATFVGLFDYYTPLERIPEEALSASFAEMFSANVESCLLAAKASLDPLTESGGSVVFTVSTSGFYPGRGGALYVPSKFAVRGLVIQLAHELAPRVRVNGVAPGGTIGTDMRGLRTLDLHDQRLNDLPDREAALMSRTPLQLALHSKDHAGSYVFLASERARGLTGVIINSDGGIGVRG
jgi:NAD(P)-dependent dehydrogenase (short-subunit alcohol dehydrogenase family)